MRKLLVLSAIALILVLTFGAFVIQNGHDLFQKALAKERAEGNLEEAITLYKQVVKEAEDAALAAKAQLRIGICYEKLGRTEARKAYEDVLSNFSDQKETADEARRRLAFLKKPSTLEDGGELSVRRVWSGPEVTTWGALSPNGRYLSFVENLNLYVRDFKTGENRRLTKGGSIESRVLAEFSVFSPDGSRIAYDWLNADGIWDLRLIGLDDAKSSVLLRRENGDFIKPLGWSPDGTRILTAFFRTAPRKLKYEIGFVSVHDGSVEIIKSAQGVSGYSYISGMSLSPDGRYIACEAPADDEAGQRDIFLLSADGSRESPLIKNPADDHSPIWSADSKRILFISDRGGKPGVWMADVTDGKIQSTPNLVKADIGLFGKWLGVTDEGECFYAIKTQREDIYIAGFNPLSLDVFREPEALVGRYVGSNTGPAWSPDGKNLAYLRHDREKQGDPGASTIIIRSIKTGEERELPNKLIQPRSIQWFPEGKSLLVSSFRSPKDRDYSIDFYRIDIKNGAANMILQGDGGTQSFRPGLSPDGRKIFFFCKKQTEETVLKSYDLESREEKGIYIPGHDTRMSVSISLSPDGHNLAFVEDNGAWPPVFTVKTMEVTGRNPRDLLSAQWPEIVNGQRALAWTADGRYLMVVKMTFGSGKKQSNPQQALYTDELLLIPVEGGDIQKMILNVRELDSLSIHPDGNLVAFSALSENPSYEIWALENFLPKEEEEEKGGRR